MVRVHLSREGSDRIKVGEVEVADLEVGERGFRRDFFDRPPASSLIAHSQDHMPAPAGDRAGRRHPETAVRSGHDEHPTGLIGSLVSIPTSLRHLTLVALSDI